MAAKALTLTAQSVCPAMDVPPALEELASVLSSVQVVSDCAAVAEGSLKIGTHSGTFHCDEALGCAMMQLHPKWKGAAVVRSRDPAQLAQCDLVMDVGGEYDHEKLRYDHHQRGFDEVLGRGFTTKLSACGLIYKHYGLEIITALHPALAPQAEMFYDKVYGSFVEHVDAIDNGIAVTQPNFSVSTTLSARVGQLNPAWNQEDSAEDSNNRFRFAMLTTGREFLGKLHGFTTSWWPARSIVKDALSKRLEVHPSGKVISLDGFCPWKTHLMDLEAEEALETPIEYVLYVSSGQWRIQCVPVASGSFQSRKPLPEPWRGIRDDQLSELSGVKDCVFVHSTGFTGGNKTREGILEMAKKSVEWEA